MHNLKSSFTIAAAFLLSLSAIAQPPDIDKNLPVIAPPQVVRPEQVISDFADAVSEHLDPEVAARFVEGGQTGDVLKPIVAELQKERAGWTIRVLQANAQVKGDIAVVKGLLLLRHHWFGKIMHQERLTLHKVGDAWKIVPLSVDDFSYSRSDSFDSDILANIATYLARPQEIHEATAFSCLSNLKQLGLATFHLIEDNNEKFAVKAATYQQSLLPYARSEQLFHCPEDKSGTISYSFNDKFDNLPLAQLAEPAHTVMIYEGKDGQLEFRHNNRAGVCFADGHCQLITPEIAKTLRWKP